MIETGDPNPKSGNTHKIVNNKKIDDIEVQDEQQVSNESDESQTKLDFN